MNDQYKNRHKPVTNNENVKFKQGYYYPENPQKCLTSVNIYRSSWEQFFMWWCDHDPSVITWASEPVGIKYLNPIANREYCLKNGLNHMDPHNWKVCTYYTDFWMEKIENGVRRRVYVEIKPLEQTRCPAPILESAPLKDHKRHKREMETFMVNQAKWAAANRYFAERGFEFVVYTEEMLKKIKKSLKLK